MARPDHRRRARPRSLAPLVAAIALLAGCSHGSSDGAARPTTTSTSTTTTIPGPTVASTGAAPRIQLRFALHEGDEQTVAVTSDVSVAQELSTGDRLIDPPPVRQVISFRVGAVDATGADVTFEVTDAKVDAASGSISPADALLLDHDLVALKGLSGSGHLLPSGRFTKVEVRLPASLDALAKTEADSLSSQLGSLGPRLPDVAVGVGASWRTTDTTRVAGIDVVQRNVVTVTGIVGHVVTYRTTTVATATNQRIRSSTLPAGTTAIVTSSRLTGTSTGTIDLGQPIGALRGGMAGTQRVRISRGKGSSADVAQRVDQRLTVGPIG